MTTGARDNASRAPVILCVRNGNQDYSTEGYEDDEQGTEGTRDADHLEFFFFLFLFSYFT